MNRIKNIRPGVLVIPDAGLKLKPGQVVEVERLTKQIQAALKNGRLAMADKSAGSGFGQPKAGRAEAGPRDGACKPQTLQTSVCTQTVDEQRARAPRIGIRPGRTRSVSPGHRPVLDQPLASREVSIPDAHPLSLERKRREPGKWRSCWVCAFPPHPGTVWAGNAGNPRWAWVWRSRPARRSRSGSGKPGTEVGPGNAHG